MNLLKKIRNGFYYLITGRCYEGCEWSKWYATFDGQTFVRHCYKCEAIEERELHGKGKRAARDIFKQKSGSD